MAVLPLDGPSLQDVEAVADDTVFRVKADSTEMEGREAIMIMPMDGKIWIFFGNNEDVPSVSDVKSKGFPHPKGALRSYEAADTQEVYIVADSGTVEVRFAERG